MKFANKHSILFLLITAVAISFLGSLPPGTTNVLTLQLASQSIHNALLFSVGCLFGEMIYVSLCVVMMNRLLKSQWVMKVLEWISFCVVLALAAASFIAAIHNSTATGENASTLITSPFVSGLILIVINPVQIPFWLGWTTVLYEKNILKPGLNHHVVYVAGSGIGSVCASVLFIIAGEFVSRQLAATRQMWNYILAIFFLVGAVLQLRNILSKWSINVRQGQIPRGIESRR